MNRAVIRAIDECPVEDLVRGLRTAVIAYRIKAGMTRSLSAKEQDRMRRMAVLLARDLLSIATADVPL